MSANEVDFSNQFRKACADYEQEIRDQLRAVFNAMDPAVRDNTSRDENLEEHIRTYVIDPLLESLNWRVGKNTIVEAFVRDRETHRRRRLDYLGFECNTTRPLLIVEAKRPDAPFLDVKRSAEPGRNYLYNDLLLQALHHLKDPGVQRPPLLDDWFEWLTDVRDYCLSTQENTGVMPIRLIITNGTWLVLLTDLDDAFKGTAVPTSSKIRLYQNSGHILENAREVFNLLDYRQLVALNQPFLPADLPAHFDCGQFEFGMSALHIFYADTPFRREPVPAVNVEPEVILRHRTGGWVRVTSDCGARLPHNPKYLDQYLDEVKVAHQSLMAQLHLVVGRHIPLLPISEHYERGFYAELPGLRRISTNEFLAITGAEPNFVKGSAEFDACRYHWFDLAAMDQVAPLRVPSGASTNPRTHFGSGTALHCAHRAVQALKSASIGTDNRARFAPRDDAEDGPFCKLWGFETFLCCHRCIFQPVCHQSVGAVMPCRHDRGA